jgi:hypothetical protein
MGLKYAQPINKLEVLEQGSPLPDFAGISVRYCRVGYRKELIWSVVLQDLDRKGSSDDDQKLEQRLASK